MVKSHSNKNDSWGMGLLFIFFHNNNNNNNYYPDDINNVNVNNNSKRNSYSLSSSSSSNLLLSKTQSTLSICALLVFTTLLLFTLSTFEPSSSGTKTTSSSRRMLSDGNGTPGALHGIGEVYLRGTKSMSDLIVAHVSEEASRTEVRSFLRVLVYSGLLSRVDLVFLFPSLSAAAEFRGIVQSECDSLLKLVRLGRFDSFIVSGLTRYLRPVGEGGKETIWGKTVKINSTESTRPSQRPATELTELTRPSYGSVTESTRPSYGSVVGFEASELDPEDALSGFLERVPMRLRRWACYPMLLGRLRRNYKHMMLVDAGNSLVLSDPFTRVRNKTSESLLIYSNPTSTPESSPRRSRRNSGKEQKPTLNPGVLIGGSRGVRRFANAALTEIVRSTIDQHKGKKRESGPSESGVVNQLVHSGHVMKNVKLITPPESIHETDSGKGLIGMGEYMSVVKRGSRSGGVDEAVYTEICSSHKLLSSVYSDCLRKSH